MDTQARESAVTRLSAVLETAASCFPRAQLPWPWLPPAGECYRSTNEPEEMLRLLCSKHDERSLLESRIVTRDKSGSVALAPQFIDQYNTIVLLRRPDGIAFDLLTANGCLSGHVPLFALWHDARFQEHLRGSQYKEVFGVGSISDCLLLRSLGLPASPVHGLERLHVKGLRWLLQLVGASLICGREWLSQCASSGRFVYPASQFALLLVAGSIEHFQPDPRDEVMSVIRHLHHAHCELKMVFEDLYVWCPDDAKRAALQHARQVGDPELMRRAFARPGKAKCIPQFVASPPSVESPTVAQLYLDNRAELQRLLSERDADKAGREKRKVVREKFEKLVQETLIAPILTEAHDSPEPVRRILGVQFAGAAERMELLALLAGAELHGLFRQAKGTDEPHPLEYLKELPRHTNELLKLAREYRRQQSGKRGWGN